MTFETIDLVVSDGVAKLTLDQAEIGNPFNERFCSDWLAVSGELAARKDVRVILLAANGKFFSVGGDIRMFVDQLDVLPERIREWTAALHTGLARFARLDAPMVAAVHGVAMGGAVALIGSCDVVYAGRGASLGAAYPAIGFSCDAGASRSLASRMGHARARRFLICGETLSAEQALASGLVDFVVDDQDVRAAAEQQAMRLAAGPTRAFGEIRRLFNKVWNQSVEAQLEDEAQALAAVAASHDAREGIRAFAAKRKPGFVGA